MHRILPAAPHTSLNDYIAGGGGQGVTAARTVSPGTVIDELIASGLRGRGGAGFPTGVKWRTVREFASPLLHTTVVVNAAEGEPGTFKDRTILRENPYAVIEGALIAAHAVDAMSIIIATKAVYTTELAVLRRAVDEITAAGWCKGVAIQIVEGPAAYLLGEETALLEVIDGRPPFPRIAPPFRHGVVEVVPTAADAASGSGQAANVQMAELDRQSAAPPVLVNNVETLANVPGIIASGASWFREVGTEQSPGTIVCTVTGDVQRPAVMEVPMGTSLSDLIAFAGGPHPGRNVSAVLVGVSSPVITPEHLDTGLSYEAMSAIGSGLGSAGFIVLADGTEPIGVAAGVARFLAIESCGQCTHCKQDGADLARVLAAFGSGEDGARALETIHTRLDTVTEGARCSLASQQRAVVGSLLDAFAEQIMQRLDRAAGPVEVQLIAGLVDITDDGAVLDETFARKQPDWTYGPRDSGLTPVDAAGDHRAGTGPTAAG